ncbi:MAG: flavodoxin family protein [Acidimicrobiales bacterium]|nr:flavodoxin family protein [Acidimicrobiales bacterium]RZV48063.1 MAG: flavodoxin family protein [Acidimicrobiales bacterium]
MQVVVTYESRTGNTRTAAQLVAGGLKDAGAEVTIGPVDTPDFKALADADLVVVGTWTDGAFFLGQRPGGAGNIARSLPDLWDKRVYSFVTYALNPGRSHEKLADLLEAKGARSLGASAFHRNRLQDDASTFVDGIIDYYGN